jgi:phage baseplate assembly protein gpV
LSTDGGSIRLEAAAHTVKVIKIVDRSVAAAAPSVSIEAPDHARVGEEIPFLGVAAPDGVPPVAYHWDFGDGTNDDGRSTTHSFTVEGSHTVRLVVDGLDGPSAEKSVTVVVSGSLSLLPPSRFKPKE